MKINFSPQAKYNNYNLPSTLSFGLRNPFTGTVPVEDVFVSQKNEGKEKPVTDAGILSKIFYFLNKEEVEILSPNVEGFFNKKDKFQISDYKKLSAEDRLKIKEKIGIEDGVAAALNITFASGLKEALDKEFGESGYVFCSIGRSPSLIAKVLECMGAEVRYFPMSKLTLPEINELLYTHTFDKYGEFLENQGITKENLESGDKKYIFYDFSNTGASLRKFKALMTERFSLPEDKMDFRSLNDELLYLFEDKIYIDDRDAVRDYIYRYLTKSGAEYYSSVAYFPVSDVDTAEYTIESLSTHDNDSVKHFNFYVMDYLAKKGLLKENPNNGCIL